MIDKTELLGQMESGRAAWERLLVRVSEPEMATPLADGWTPKDIVAHIAACERWTAAQINAALRDEEPTARELYGVDETPPGVDTGDTDARNIAFLAYYRDATLADVLAMAQHAFESLIDAVQDAPEMALADPNTCAWTGGQAMLEIIPWQSYRHYEQHTPALLALVGEMEGQGVDAAGDNA